MLALGLGSHMQMAHVVIADNNDEDEGEGAKDKGKTNLSTPLDQTLATAFTLNQRIRTELQRHQPQLKYHLWPVVAHADCGGRHTQNLQVTVHRRRHHNLAHMRVPR
jgi:hypothetical protein